MVLARFLPRNEQFFKHFSEAAANAADAASLLASVVEHGASDEFERRVRRLRDLEHRGDELTHQVYNALNSTFVTPLDREDIRDLASQIDDIVDDIEEVGRRLLLYRLPAPPDPMRLFTRILVEQTALLVTAAPLLENVGKHGAELRRQILEIHRLENEGDDALNQALAHLYDGVTEIPSLIVAMRWGELFGLLEDATDRAEDVANTLEGIVLKHA